MIHVRQEDVPWIQKKGYSKKILFNGGQIEIPGTLVQVIRIQPGEVAKSHYHKVCTEVFYFPAVNGEFYVDGIKINLCPSDILVIQPGDYHEVRNPSSQDFCYVAFKVNVVDNDYFEST